MFYDFVVMIVVLSMLFAHADCGAVKALQEWDDLSSSDQFLNYL
jgi:hypothetical protein